VNLRHALAGLAGLLPLAAAAVARGLPLLGICRGLQELNVALGGSLHPAVHEVPGRLDHRAPAAAAPARYATVHPVRFVPGGALEGLTGLSGGPVNSLHGQAIDRLGAGLLVDALAPDDTIEAITVKGHPFALAVQWHLEWRATEDQVSRRVYEAFGRALR